MPTYLLLKKSTPLHVVAFTALLAFSSICLAENKGEGGPVKSAPKPEHVNPGAEHRAPARVESHHPGPGRPGMEHHGAPHYGMGREHHVFAHHDVHRFNHSELAYWRGGRWNNSCRGGQCGWWWYTGGQWYLYDRPTYPYPLVVSGMNFLEPVAVLAAPVALAAPIAPAPQTPVAAPPQFLYFCDNPKGYYPQVSSCPTGYREVSGR